MILIKIEMARFQLKTRLLVLNIGVQIAMREMMRMRTRKMMGRL